MRHMTRDEIRLITLDLDETLWPLEPTIQAAEAALMQWLAERAPDMMQSHDPQSLRAHRRALIHERPEIAHDVTEVRRISIERLLCDHGHVPDEARELAAEAMAVFLAQRNRVRPYADTPGALRGLGACYRLISVTNGNADPDLTPLAGLFEHRVTAAAAGAAKPDPAIFELALALAGCTPEQCLHVGDEPLLDVEAARSIGIARVWVNRTKRDWPRDLEPPAHSVGDLDQLADWLGVSTGGQDGV